MELIITLHGGLSNTLWLFFLVVGLWGVVRAIRGLGVDGSYLGAMAIGQILYWLQGIFGVTLWASGFINSVAKPEMHILYGAFSLVFLPFVYLVWLRGDDSNRGQWVMALATLFMFGIALRAISTVGA